jgi:TetR/AcrR family tetracycline transcriptional repressor
VTELPPPPWERTPRRASRPRREPLSQEAIIRAAVAVLDADGLDRLSMRHVAKTLNTGAATLYWHVGSKDGLLDLVFDHIIGEQNVPDPDAERWEEQLREVARTMRATLLRHRDVVRLSIGRMAMGPNALRYGDRLLGILRAGGVPPDLAVTAQRLLIAIVNGFSIDDTEEGGRPPADRPADAARLAREYAASLPPERFPQLVAHARHFAGPGRDQEFELLLDLFVEGLAQRVATRSPAGAPGSRPTAAPRRAP